MAITTGIAWTQATWNPGVLHRPHDRKGADIAGFPPDLRLREFPLVRTLEAA